MCGVLHELLALRQQSFGIVSLNDRSGAIYILVGFLVQQNFHEIRKIRQRELVVSVFRAPTIVIERSFLPQRPVCLTESEVFTLFHQAKIGCGMPIEPSTHSEVFSCWQRLLSPAQKHVLHTSTAMSNPNSSGKNLGQVLSVRVMTEAARREPISQASARVFP